MIKFLLVSSKSKSRSISSSSRYCSSIHHYRSTLFCNSTSLHPHITPSIPSHLFNPSAFPPKEANFTDSAQTIYGYLAFHRRSGGYPRFSGTQLSVNRSVSRLLNPKKLENSNRSGSGFWRTRDLVGGVRSFSGESDRDSMQYDVVIVGAGPAGLSAAIRLKQICREKDVDLSVCVVEKGAEVGAHIISGNVFEPRALDELLPQWKQEEAPINVPVSSDKFCLLTKDRAFPLPCPFDNKGNYVISLSQLVRWLGVKAEELGVEIYPGFAASEVLYDANNKVIGIATNDMGIAKDGSSKDNFQRGVELKGRVTLLAEGCRGSLSEKIIRNYKLREKGQGQHQTYALGIKEVWEIDEDKHKPGSVLHTVGWPLDHQTYGGSFLYHMKDRQVSVGLVVALNYHNPFLNPYEEFQKLKCHPAIRPLLEGGTVLQYGARALNEGGFQSIPYPVFPGGAIIGCAAGFLNVPKIKGTHTAMKSGMIAAESAFSLLHEELNMETYWDNLKNSWIWEELHGARNYRPAFKYGLIPGLALSALEHYILKGRSPLTLKHEKPDHEMTKEAQLCSPIHYPKPDGIVSFDVPTSLYRSNTNHDHDQPAHLRLRDPKIPEIINMPKYAGPESRYCPARVYEYVPDEKGQLKLQINAQNCLHCKACDIKDPKQNIEWTVPEGGGGPGYSIM
ncbi:electron transfer flavoprotein-ubiquinone oxidoreductase, mitochondrial isoform X2 [Cornus florida]|uniref:electron transfer flavoprotein-ubiquinone oxidoreductase, mitochondrial isoform X2 n=1 Tax=Cornus florida TaxID=4283 RepID=UPI00289F5E00|nr:electron transfer flavoprotein-ubiquinone oxidoreductase, mitochondrial isoform X2 [Cornus florida]